MMKQMKELLAGSRLCVLATCTEDRPHCSLMSCAFDEDSLSVYMVTPRETRKWGNMNKNPFVSLLVDTREDGRGSSGTSSMALTVNGKVEGFPEGAQEAAARKLLLDRHPELEAFLSDESAVVFRVRIQTMQLLIGLSDSHFVDLAEG